MYVKYQLLALLCAGVILFSTLTGGAVITTFHKVESPENGLPEISKPLDFTWNPYVYSDLFRQVYGQETEQVYLALVDAMLTGAERFPCPDEGTMYIISDVARLCFPPISAILSGMAFAAGEVILTYSGEAREQVLEQFEKQITGMIRSAVREGDSPAMAAISLYHQYVRQITYDYTALADDVLVDVSSYRALTELAGICQSFAPAYAYLCLQCGIEAVTTGGMTETFEAHEWNMLTLDGHYYYADPTFENGMGGSGLRYFGMTAARRELEGGFIAAEYNVGNVNEIWGSDVDVTDERFAPLWEAAAVSSLERKDGKLYLNGEQSDGTPFLFVLD